MDFDEFSKVAIELKAAYPNHKLLLDDAAIVFWYKMLKDIPGDVCEAGVIELIQTQTFPPSIAEIRERCANRIHGKVKDVNEAWTEVLAVCGKYGRDRQSDALAQLDSATVEVVKMIGYRNICLATDQFSNRKAFESSYKRVAEETELNHRMALDIKQGNALIESNGGQ